MKFLSLFSGIGGLDLGLEWAGWECVGQCELNQFGQAVLAKHWPNVARWSDVREINSVVVAERIGHVDAIVGGFPCQPWSVAGKALGKSDPRDLWPEFIRVVREVRPRWIIGENVPGLLARGGDAVLDDLQEEGYACWPVVLGADDIGAPHKRKRVFFIARRKLADPIDTRHQGPVGSRETTTEGNSGGHAAKCGAPVPRPEVGWPAGPAHPRHQWECVPTSESTVGMPANGSARGFSRWRRASLMALGNMVVPQVAEVIGCAVLNADRGGR